MSDNKRMLVAGTELHLLQFWTEHINYFESLGYEVDIVTAECAGRLDELKEVLKGRNIEVIPSRRNPLKTDNIRALKQLKQKFKSTRYDCILTNEPVMSVLIRLAAQKSRKSTGTKVIYMAHGFHFFKGNKTLNNIIFHAIEKHMSRKTDAIVTSNYEDYNAAKAFKTGVDVYHIDGMGCKSYRFSVCRDKDLKNSRRAELGIKEGETALVFAGELNKNKNQIVLLQGIKILKDKGYNVKLLLCGKGAEFDNLSAYCKDNGIEDKVTFLGYRKDVNEIFPVCDIGCSSSIREGFGLNIAEYMVCGLPVVVSRNRAHVDIVEDGVNGFIFDPFTPAQFAEGVKKIIDNEGTYSFMSKINIAKAEKYDIKIISEKISKIAEEQICKTNH